MLFVLFHGAKILECLHVSRDLLEAGQVIIRLEGYFYFNKSSISTLREINCADLKR